MLLVKDVSDYVQRLLRQPSSEMTGSQRYVRFAVELAMHGFRELRRDNAAQMAAALTYRTLFSLLPMLVLAMIILKAFATTEAFKHEQERFKSNLVQYMLPAALVKRDIEEMDEAAGFLDTAAQKDPVIANIDAALADVLPGGPLDISDGPPTGVDPDTGEAVEVIPEEITAEPSDPLATSEEMSAARRELGEKIQHMIDRLSEVNVGGIGIVGLLIFFYAATTLLVTIEKSFNHVYQAEQGRSWTQRFVYYFCFVTLGPFVIITGQIAQSRFITMLEGESLLAWASKPLVFITPVATAWLVLLALYQFMPRTRVHIKPAAIGSLVASILWVIGKELFTVYASRAAISSLYGALGLIPLFLLWIYITWYIVLFGLELSFTLQAMRGNRFREEDEDWLQRQRFCDPDWVVPVISMIGRSFEQGKACALESIYHDLDVPRRPLNYIVSQLEARGLIHHVEVGEEGEPTLALGRPAEHISLVELFDFADEISHPHGDKHDNTPDWMLLRDLAAKRREALGDRNLASLIREGDA